MAQMHPINRTLLTILDNQTVRTSCAFEGLSDAVFTASPGADCKSIRDIGRHLLHLRRFQLSLLGSPLADKVADPQSAQTLSDLMSKLETATAKVQQAIATHDAEDWYRVPEVPREGRWGNEPSIERVVRPLNDFTNHLGSVRAIRRSMGEPAKCTQ